MSEFYVARDDDGDLRFYSGGKPYKGACMWLGSVDCGCCTIDQSLLPEVRWEDEEPTEVEIIIKQKVEKPHAR